MIDQTGLIRVVAKEDAVAYANGVAQKFKVSPVMFDGSNGTELTVEFDAFNYTESDISKDDGFYVGKTIQGYWVPLASVSSGIGIIEFVFDEGYDEGEGDENCIGEDEEEPEAITSRRAKITRRPCGVCRVPGEDDEGYVVVHDSAYGGFLEGRSESQIAGMGGFAAYMSEDEECGGYNECQWVIKWMNWFSERQAVQDWYISDLDIIEEKMNIKVWSYCRLPDEITEGVDCAEETYYGEDQVTGEE